MRQAIVKVNGTKAGILTQDSEGYHFKYDSAYIADDNSKPVSLTLPKREASYDSKIIFPFFDGLIPEGWLLYLAEKNWKLDARDRMGLLLVCCKDCIGSVSIEEIKEDN